MLQKPQERKGHGNKAATQLKETESQIWQYKNR